MRDNIRSLVGHREKKSGANSEKNFFSAREDAHVSRIDLRWSDGTRKSLPYAHLHHIEFWPGDASLEKPQPDAILLDCPAYSRTQITGFGLLPLYEALQAESVTWIREMDADEPRPEGGPFIEEINHLMLTDWQLELESVEHNRETVLGARQYPRPEGTAS